MTVRIISTMTQSVTYNIYQTVENLPVAVDGVTIRGGAGIPSARSGFGEQSSDAEGHPIWTAKGIVTTISDEKYAILKEHNLFKKHLERGFVKVITYDIEGNHKAVEKETRGMAQKDAFAQLTKETADKRIKATTKTLDTESQLRL